MGGGLKKRGFFRLRVLLFFFFGWGGDIFGKLLIIIGSICYLSIIYTR